MSVPPPPPPPPPSAALKAPIPATNNALLSSIQKGTKLKKVPEAAKNDRSEVKLSNAPINNGPQKPTMNGTNSSAQEGFRRISQSGSSTNKQFPDIQSVLMNQISAVNLRKTSVPVNINQPARPAFKSNTPLPNQLNSAVKAPPPPPQTAKPVLRPSLSEQRTDYQDTINKPLVQPPMRKAPQSQPNQMSNARNISNVSANTRASNPTPPPPLTKKVLEPQKSQPNFSVIRKTPNPPPPLARGSADHSKAPSTNPPPVPQRIANSTSSVGHATTSQNRPVSSSGSNQYKVFDRPPPPPPPMNNSIQLNQRTSFDQRFQFPNEKSFPKPDFNAIGNRYSQSSGSVEAFSH